jgi:hypothetical protein
MKRLVIVVLALAAFVPATANAAVPCRDRIYNDWYADGKIATTYSAGCYRDALKNIPPDARTYSSLADDIRAAMRGAQARHAGHTGVPAQIGKGVEPTAATVSTPKAAPKKRGGAKTTLSEKSPLRSTQQSRSRAVPTSTVAADPTSGSSSGVPVPLLVLGALALLLIAVGAAGAIAKRRRI